MAMLVYQRVYYGILILHFQTPNYIKLHVCLQKQKKLSLYQQHPHLMGSYLRLSAALYWEGPSIFQ